MTEQNHTPLPEWRFGLLNEGGSGEIAAIFLGDSNDVVMTSYNRVALERAAEAVNAVAALQERLEAAAARADYLRSVVEQLHRDAHDALGETRED